MSVRPRNYRLKPLTDDEIFDILYECSDIDEESDDENIENEILNKRENDASIVASEDINRVTEEVLVSNVPRFVSDLNPQNVRTTSTCRSHSTPQKSSISLADARSKSKSCSISTAETLSSEKSEKSCAPSSQKYSSILFVDAVLNRKSTSGKETGNRRILSDSAHSPKKHYAASPKKHSSIPTADALSRKDSDKSGHSDSRKRPGISLAETILNPESNSGMETRNRHILSITAPSPRKRSALTPKKNLSISPVDSLPSRDPGSPASQKGPDILLDDAILNQESIPAMETRNRSILSTSVPSPKKHSTLTPKKNLSISPVDSLSSRDSGKSGSSASQKRPGILLDDAILNSESTFGMRTRNRPILSANAPSPTKHYAPSPKKHFSISTADAISDKDSQESFQSDSQMRGRVVLANAPSMSQFHPPSTTSTKKRSCVDLLTSAVLPNTRARRGKSSCAVPSFKTSDPQSQPGASNVEQVDPAKKAKKRVMSEKEKSRIFKEFHVTPKGSIHWMEGVEFVTPKLKEYSFVSEEVQEIGTPFHYFSRYLPPKIFEDMAYYTNLYAVQKNILNFPSTTETEMREFCGIQLMMGNLKYPRVRMYWDRKFNIPFISSVMPVNRFFKLRSAFHVVDVTDPPKNNDRLWKIRPLYESIQNRCHQLTLEKNLSVDEQMVPFKGQISIKQYMKDKPTPWGIKIYTLCGQSGLLYDFVIYQGSTTEIPVRYDAFGLLAAIVMTLTRRIHSEGHYLYFDNLFSSYQLLQWLAMKKLYSTCTVRADRFAKPPLWSSKEVKNLPRGSTKISVSRDAIIFTQWLDRKPLSIASNYVGKGRESTCLRWSDGKQIKVSRPQVVTEYNDSMGGTDKLDMLISLYRIFIRNRKWTLRMLTHALDLAVTNAWLEYRRDCAIMSVPKKDIIDLIHFRGELAETMMKIGSTPEARRRGRPSSHTPSPASSRESTPVPSMLPPTTPTTPKRPRENLLPDDVRKDQLNHWPILGAVQRCKNKGCNERTVFECTKCGVHLCINRKRNCFYDSHN